MGFLLGCGDCRRASEENAELSDSVPWIDDGDSRLLEVANIACNDREAVVDGGRGNNQVRLREGVPRLSAPLYLYPPLKHNFFCNLENSSVEHWPNLVRQPIVEQSSAAWVANEFNTKSNLRKGYHTDKKLMKRASSHEGHDPWVGI